jgi:pimeloyl-ACP methyl ester carboxylesterase
VSDTVLLSAPGVSERCEMGEFSGSGGRRLRYSVVRAPREHHTLRQHRAAREHIPARERHTPLLYLHGIESHGGWFLATAKALARRGYTTYLLDRRGSGLNRHPQPGDAASAAVLLEDVRRFRADAGLDELALIGLSWGGKLALVAALDQPAGVQALVLVTPGLVPAVGYSPLARIGIALSLAVGGRARFRVPIEPEMFTQTPRYLDYIRSDPLRLHRATARLLRASLQLDRAIRARLHQLSVPVLLFLAERDHIIDNDRTRALLERLPRGQLRIHAYEGAAHSIQLEETERLARDIDAFLEELPCWP